MSKFDLFDGRVQCLSKKIKKKTEQKNGRKEEERKRKGLTREEKGECVTVRRKNGFAILTRRTTRNLFLSVAKGATGTTPLLLFLHRKKIYIVYHHTSSGKKRKIKKKAYSPVPSNIFAGASLSLCFWFAQTRICYRCQSVTILPRPEMQILCTTFAQKLLSRELFHIILEVKSSRLFWTK